MFFDNGLKFHENDPVGPREHVLTSKRPSGYPLAHILRLKSYL